MDQFTRQLRVRTDECGANCRVNPSSILHWIQDLAEEHASAKGFGYEFCMENTLAWVEFHLAIRILRLPEWKETLTVSTWTYPATPLIAYRDFSVRDSRDIPLLEATCQWVLIDAIRRRPVSLKKYITHFPEDTCRPLVPQDPQTSQATTLPELDINTKPTRRFHAERSFVDFNRHINNSAYLIWALDSLPDDWLAAKHPTSISIAFRKETMPGEEILSFLQLGNNRSLHTLRCGDQTRATLDILWEND